ncbi:hypothetical protein [Paraburkholderia tagetis]|uniref:Uncharacterized protein n=1 Tax=Paraburkholderia tagetis TaxID=2913261 RepID=A0A9X1UF45_9BURK|nr:hypothetical protein [Paraburkholderia tagetis]MCG5074274.1 hypothetical protein [Paraburkholderia tagetis]
MTDIEYETIAIIFTYFEMLTRQIPIWIVWMRNKKTANQKIRGFRGIRGLGGALTRAVAEANLSTPEQNQMRSMAMAMPWPTPIHIVHSA